MSSHISKLLRVNLPLGEILLNQCILLEANISLILHCVFEELLTSRHWAAVIHEKSPGLTQRHLLEPRRFQLIKGRTKAWIAWRYLSGH
jgi:hypothetical protein